MFAQNILRHSGDHRLRSHWQVRARQFSVVRWLSTLALGVFAVSTAACSKVPQKPPEAPLKQAVKEAPFEEDMLDHDTHRAPPPAYGNKVVMAEREPSGVHF
jgi:hypothetical protein